MASKLVQMKGSDLHLKVGVPPVIQVHDLLPHLEGYQVLRSVDTEDILKEIIPENRVEEFEEEGQAGFSYQVVGGAASGLMPSGSGG